MRLILQFPLLLLPFLLAAQSTAEFKKALDKIIRYDTDISLEKTPGYIVGMIDGDSVYIASYGSAVKDSTVAITSNTVFEIGSLSKVFTASLVSVLVDEGLLAYDDPVNPLLPAAARNPRADSLRVHHLLSHTSGFTRLPKDFGLRQKDADDPYADYTKEDLLAFYGAWHFNDWNPDEYRYSHVNYALLEIIVEQLTGRSYWQLLEEKIIQPLGMTDTYLELDERVVAKSAKGYTVSGRPTAFKTYGSFAGAMGLKSSLRDLVKFTQAHLGISGGTELESVLQGNLREQAPTGIRKDVSVAYAWHLLKPRRYYDVVSHPGRVGGHQVTLHFVPETKTAVIVLANSDASLENLGYMALALVNNHWKKRRKVG